MAKIEFKIPDGYIVPEGTQDGQEFDESVTFKLKGGKLCLVEIADTPMPGYEDKDEEGEKAGEGLASRYQQAMMPPPQ